METSSESVLVVERPSSCTCGYHGKHSVTVESVEQHDGVGWKVRGKGRITVQCHCPLCGAMCDAVRTEIPIECHSYACPKCGRSQNLKYKIKKIDAQGNNFSFEAEIYCPTCGWKKSFAQALKSIFRLKKLEIKVTGVSLERYDAQRPA
jgi:RecJ-like exonuclease